MIVLGPFLFTALPPLTDYPNHLARFWLIAGGVNDPRLASFYRIDWSNTASNLGVDLVVSVLARTMPAFSVGYLAALLAAILPPLGALALNRRLFGGASPWQALIPIAAWSTTFLMGFLNFQIGIGLALLFVAVDPHFWSRSRVLIVAIRVGLGLVLAIDHLFALIFYAALLSALGFGRAAVVTSDWLGLRHRLVTACMAVGPCLLSLAAILALSHPLPGAQAHATLGPIDYGSVPDRLATLVSALVSYNVPLELALAALMAAFVVWLARTGRLEAHSGLTLTAAALMLLAAVTPTHMVGSGWVDRRLPIMALLAMLSGARVKPGLTGPQNLQIALAALGLMGLRTSWVAWNWRAMDANLATTQRVMAAITPGSRLLTVQHDPGLLDRFRAPEGRYMFSVGDDMFRHYGSLATPLRQAFVPNLFAARGLQPLQVRGDWDRWVEHDGGDLASVNALRRSPKPREPSYLPGWQSHFDYVLVLNADLKDEEGPFIPPAQMHLITDQGFAQLWKVSP